MADFFSAMEGSPRTMCHGFSKLRGKRLKHLILTATRCPSLHDVLLVIMNMWYLSEIALVVSLVQKAQRK